MLGTTGLMGSSEEGGGATPHDGSGGGGRGEVVVGSSGSGSSIMGGGGIGDDENNKGIRQHSGGGSGEQLLFESGSGGGGNRWPRQETLALLKIRSDMDVTFRDSSLKGPLWEEVSRKMAELGYHRSAKKCKEKFENVYKYHKRTKEGRVGKSEGKTYRFFDQLEAFDQQQQQHHQHQHHHSSSSSLPPLPPASSHQPLAQQPHTPPQAAVPVAMVMPADTTSVTAVTVPSGAPLPFGVIQQVSNNNTICHQMSQQLPPEEQVQPQHQPMLVAGGGAVAKGHSSPIQMESRSTTPSSSSSTSSDEELLGRRKRKRKWKDFFERLMKEFIDKQEELQRRFLETVDKKERDRVAREEAWKRQEIDRLNREHEILAVHERSMAAAKDSALMSFLHKLSEQHQIPIPPPLQQNQQQQQQQQQQPQVKVKENPISSLLPTTEVPTLKNTASTQQPASTLRTAGLAQKQAPTLQPAALVHQPAPMSHTTAPTAQVVQQAPPAPVVAAPQQQHQALVLATSTANAGGVDLHNGGNATLPASTASSSRWPKAEVQALINLRTSLDKKYQENGPKGPIWEEISGLMRKMGYNRNAKRCKEKWENINKYFKKVKESNKRRPDDAKTCPYFHQLDALYRDKSKTEYPTTTTNNNHHNPSASTSAYGSGQTIRPDLQQHWLVQAQPGNGDHAGSDSDMDEEDEDDQGSAGYEIVEHSNNRLQNS